MAAGSTTLRGSLALVPNPCTTEPCLPGIALALQAEFGTRLWFLTRQGTFLSDPPEFGPNTPPVGSLVRAIGVPGQGHDVHGEPFATLEIEDLDLDQTH